MLTWRMDLEYFDIRYIKILTSTLPFQQIYMAEEHSIIPVPPPPAPPSNKERLKCSHSLVHRTMYQEKITNRQEQIIAAVDFCRSNNCRDWKALSTGCFPLVSVSTINRVLDGKVKDPTHAKEYCSVLSVEEESVLVK